MYIFAQAVVCVAISSVFYCWLVAYSAKKVGELGLEWRVHLSNCAKKVQIVLNAHQVPRR